MPESNRPQSPFSNRFAATPFDAEASAPVPSDSVRLQQIIGADDLYVVFQPIVELDPVRIFAYEALVRCRVPAFSDPTKLFVRAVEEGCCGRLGRMIREIAVPLCAGIPIFLNVHPLELQERWIIRPDDPMFFHDNTVFLEVTESVPFTHFDLCSRMLNELRGRGHVQLVVDDLGAGYSNLKRIADLEPSVVKLDRGLIAGIRKGSRQFRLVASVVRLCEDLDAKVVAEGIETAAELDALRDTGIHYAQGFYFARPAFPLPTVMIT